MSKSSALFQLVKSLNQSEKRYIKLCSRKDRNKKKKKYLKLFEIMLKFSQLDEYREDLIESEMAKIDEFNNLSYYKNYLYQFILKCLRNYYKQSTPRIQLQELLTDINILYSKGLLKECLKQIKKAKKIAEKYDFNLQFLDISFLERRILRQFAVKNSKSKLNLIHEESEEKLSKIKLLLDTLSGYEDLFLRIKNFGSSKLPYQAIEKQIGKIADQNIDNNTSFEVFMYYHLTQSMHYFISGNWEKRSEHLKSILRYFDEHNYLLNDTQYQERYLFILNNYINYCYSYGTEEELKFQIDALNGKRTNSKKLNIHLEQSEYYCQILYSFKRKRFDEIVTLAPKLNDLLQKYESNLTFKRILVFKFYMTASFLLEKKYAEAEIKINEIINQPKFKTRTDIQMLIRFFRIILYYEQNYCDIAEYEIISSLRYLKKERSNILIEKKILTFLRKLLLEKTSKVIFEEFYEYLVDKREYKVICFWVEKKLRII